MKLSFIKTLFIETYRGASLVGTLANYRLKGIKLEGKILDLGSGKGLPSYFRFLQLDKNSKVVSTDIFEENEPDLKIDLEKPLPIKENEFDYVLCFNLLEHIFNYKPLIGESRRVLKENGKLIGFVPFLKNIHPDPNDYFRYTHSTLRKLFKKTGFKEIKIEAIGCGPFSASYSIISFVFPRFIKFIIVAIVMMMDNLLITIKKKLNKNQYPLGYYFECQK